MDRSLMITSTGAALLATPFSEKGVRDITEPSKEAFEVASEISMPTIMQTHFKSGKQLRRERRAKERKK